MRTFKFVSPYFLMAKQLTLDQRGRLAEKVMEWGNLVFAGLVIGQLISGAPFNLQIALGGIIGISGAYIVAILVMKGGGKK